MADIFYLKKGDTYPAIEVQLTDGEGTPVNLTGASVNFRCSVVGTGNLFIDASATVTDAALGKVSYQWQTGDTDIVGSYQMEWRVTFSDLTIATFPRGANVQFNTLIVQQDVD